jgi:site-specific recombinase XerC
MGTDRIRHLVLKSGRYYWQPSATVKSLGLTPENLGTDPIIAAARAAELNGLADQIRRAGKTGANGPLPGTFSRLFREFRESEDFAELKSRSQRDYIYYLEKIDSKIGHTMVRAATPKGIKIYYKSVRRGVSVTWGYHILTTLRAVLSWAVSEDWIKQNPALQVKLKSPKKREVIWKPEEAEAYIVKAGELGWHSIEAMAHVFDSIGQSPVDVRTLTRKAYDGRGIVAPRAKTGVGGVSIPLFPQAVAALDAYLATQPPKLPDAPLFTNDRIGGAWNESTLQKKHRAIRNAAGLPTNLQLQDFRTTAATEAGAASGTRDELRGLLQHSTGEASEHYVYPDARFVDSIQDKRLALRNKSGAKVGTASS